jgi:hypothetical protein
VQDRIRGLSLIFGMDDFHGCEINRMFPSSLDIYYREYRIPTAEGLSRKGLSKKIDDKIIP